MSLTTIASRSRRTVEPARGSTLKHRQLSRTRRTIEPASRINQSRVASNEFLSCLRRPFHYITEKQGAIAAQGKKGSRAIDFFARFGTRGLV